MRKVFKRVLFVLFFSLLITGNVSSVNGSMGAITAEAAAKVKLSKSKVSITKGKTYKLTIKNVKAGTKVKWSTSKKSVATVKASGTSATVTAKKAGTTTITAKVGKKSYKCKISVKTPPVALSAKSKTLYLGDSFNLSLNNTKSSVKWSTSNKKIAAIKKVSKYKYRVTAKKLGTAKVTAKVGGKKFTCKVSVVARPAVVVPTPAPAPAPKPTTPNETDPTTPSNSPSSIPVNPTPSNPVTPVVPSTPQTEAPKPPQTEAPKPVETEAPKPVSNPEMSASSLNLKVGETATVTLRNATGSIAWSTINGNLVEVSSSGNTATIRAVAEGTAYVRAIYNNSMYSCAVYISPVETEKPAETEKPIESEKPVETEAPERYQVKDYDYNLEGLSKGIILPEKENVKIVIDNKSGIGYTIIKDKSSSGGYYYGVRITFIKTGSTNITFVGEKGDIIRRCTVNFSSLPEYQVARNAFRKTLVPKFGWESGDSIYTKLDKACRYVATTYKYSSTGAAVGYENLETMGGSCGDSATFMLDLAKDFGLEAFIVKPWYGASDHMVAKVLINGEWYNFDAQPGTQGIPSKWLDGFGGETLLQ